MKNRFKIWESALLLALSAALLAGVWASAAGGRVSSQLVRLHVIAHSDAPEEQAVKLEVRDSVLAYLEPRLAGAEDAAAAGGIIAASIDGIAAAARSAAGGRAVRVELGEEYYPTREYESFSLPAGRYQSLRVTLGDGAGRNWWCVVFPPLCLTAAESEAAFSGLDAATRGIITGGDGDVVIKFRLLELWGELRRALGL